MWEWNFKMEKKSTPNLIWKLDNSSNSRHILWNHFIFVWNLKWVFGIQRNCWRRQYYPYRRIDGRPTGGSDKMETIQFPSTSIGRAINISENIMQWIYTSTQASRSPSVTCENPTISRFIHNNLTTWTEIGELYISLDLRHHHLDGISLDTDHQSKVDNTLRPAFPPD